MEILWLLILLVETVTDESKIIIIGEQYPLGAVLLLPVSG
jgi:hypothetical protein